MDCIGGHPCPLASSGVWPMKSTNRSDVGRRVRLGELFSCLPSFKVTSGSLCPLSAASAFSQHTSSRLWLTIPSSHPFRLRDDKSSY